MGKNKRQFIDKKSAHKFTLVHRSQRDPLQADEDSSQHVLLPVGDTVPGDNGATASSSSKEEYTKFGIDFDDDYDYMQHLRPRGEGMLVCADEMPSRSKDVSEFQAKSSEKISFGNLLLPSEVLPSQVEEDVGMLNKGVLPRGPQPDWDPDIVAALDEALDMEDPDNILEDDFMMMANGEKPGEVDIDHNEVSEGNEDAEWETASEDTDGSYIDSDDLLSDEELVDSEEETKSRFTNYSMTSSIIRRTEGLKLLDDRFERIMEEYDEDGIGCMDHEEVTGSIDVKNDLVSQIVDEFIDEHKLHDLSELKDDDDENKPCEDSDDSVEESDEKLFAQFDKKPKEKWDCESIISTYSNIYNHPKLIVEEKKTRKFELDKHTGLPMGVLSDNKKCSQKSVDIENSDVIEEQIALNNLRNKNETADEKKQRKQDVKRLRRDRRVEKKNNRQAFKNEYKKQEKVVMNTEVQKGIKM